MVAASDMLQMESKKVTETEKGLIVLTPVERGRPSIA